MGIEVNDLWIIKHDGVHDGEILFQDSNSNLLDPLLFKKFIQILISFSNQFTKGDLKKFEIGNYPYYIFQRKSLIYIVNTSKKIKDINKINKELNAYLTKSSIVKNFEFNS